LNGVWEFEIDNGDSGFERGLLGKKLAQEIKVPFCPESELSGIGNIDFMNAVWYRKEVEIPFEWGSRNVLLHFQAVDYDVAVWVNGKEVIRHRGGFSPFSCNLKGIVRPGGKALIVVRARKPKNHPRPSGKQSPKYENYSCFYTRTTGIWQTVWMEPVPDNYLQRPRITPDVANRLFHIEQPVKNNITGLKVRATLRDDEGVVAISEVGTDVDFAPVVDLKIPENRVKLWGPGAPNLYDITIELLDSSGDIIDIAETYAGLRSIAIDGKKVKINGEVVFQRQVLDQGYYPDGIMTAPCDEALSKDIELAMNAGFNSARLHQKVFEERFLYHADKMGYLVWGEFGDWGVRNVPVDWLPDPHYYQPKVSMVAQWLEVLERDYNHPCIVGWCPLNETWEQIEDRATSLDELTRALFLATKAMDQSRPVIDASGYSHRVAETDIYDSHCYEQDPVRFKELLAGLAKDKPLVNPYIDPLREPEFNNRGDTWSLPYRGQPYFVSEFGGIKWHPDFANTDGYNISWGYGETPRSSEEFYERFEALCNVLLDDPNMFGYCYTQLTDIYKEQNGIYFFDRMPKFDIERLRTIQQRKAAIEKQNDSELNKKKKKKTEKVKMSK
jgi:beta-galactosidase/beta-glucuronidase